MNPLFVADFTDLTEEEKYADNPNITGLFYIMPVFGSDDGEDVLRGIAIADSKSGMFTCFIGEDHTIRATDYFNEFRQIEEGHLIVSLEPSKERAAAIGMFNAFARRLGSVHNWDIDRHNYELLDYTIPESDQDE